MKKLLTILFAIGSLFASSTGAYARGNAAIAASTHGAVNTIKSTSQHASTSPWVWMLGIFLLICFISTAIYSSYKNEIEDWFIDRKLERSRKLLSKK